LNIRELSRSTGSRLILRRWIATWIDFAVLFLLLVVAESLLGRDLYQATIWFWVILLFVCHPILEGLAGRTLGRIATGTVVVDGSGGRPGLWRAILRSLLRWIEVNPFLIGGVPAGIVVLMSKHRQRLGDMVAGTYVVRTADLLATSGEGGQEAARRLALSKTSTPDLSSDSHTS
jgi:uncharacterized RDD family membrane protein YckC